MRGLVAVAGVLCVAVLAARSWSGATTTTTAVGVSEREWSVSLGRLKAPHGRIELYVHNYGQDDHNIAVRRLGVQYGFTGRIASGGQKTLALTLKPGVYNLFCSLPGQNVTRRAATTATTAMAAIRGLILLKIFIADTPDIGKACFGNGGAIHHFIAVIAKKIIHVVEVTVATV